MQINKEIADILDDVEIEEILPKGVTVSNLSKNNPVRNLRYPYLAIKNAKLFTPAANFFDECKAKFGQGKYTHAIKGTTQYRNFWKEEYNRCINGYEPLIDGVPCGVKVTGVHYFYLNYCIIEKQVKHKQTGQDLKEDGFPQFLLMDLYYFWELEWNEQPEKFNRPYYEKKGMIVAKARRKGWSFKNAAVCVHKYSFFKKSFCVVASYLKSHAEKTFKMCLDMSNHLNKYTEFGHKRGIKDTMTEITSGRKFKKNGIEVFEGFQSSIKLMTFKDSDFKSVGNSATIFPFEEAGTFDNLLQVYQASEPLWKSGDYSIGIPLIFGTGGDMTNVTKGFADMFYNPEVYGLASYDNIYDEGMDGKCGYFIDEMWYRECEEEIDGVTYRGVDLNGNPCRWIAELNLDRERALKKKGRDKSKYVLTITQKCKTPAEAFMMPEGNIFPIAELYDRLSKLKADDNYKYIGTPGEIIFSDDEYSHNGVKFLADLENKLNPLYEYPSKVGTDRDGAIVIYEAPIMVDGVIPPDMYFISHDPFAMNTDTGESLGSTFVLMSPKYMKYGGDRIVAEYTGRPSGGNSMTFYNTNLEKLSMYYGNAKIMYEVSTGQGDVLNHFTKRKKLGLLSGKPMLMLSRNLGTVKSSYTYGCAINEVNKGDLEQYLYDWLLAERGENEDGKKEINIDHIPSKALLEELIMYSRDRNCDRVSAMFMMMVIREERTNKFAEEVKVKKETAMDWLSNNKTIFPNRNQSPKNDKWVFKL